MKSALYNVPGAKADMLRAWIYHARAKRLSYTLINNKICMKIPEKFDDFRGFSSFFYWEASGIDDICRVIVDRRASGRVWVADVERFFMEMVENGMTCASQSWLQVSVGQFWLQMWWG